MYDKHKSYYLNGETIKPTFKLQMKSLETFAGWIGYEMCPNTCQFEYIFGYDSTDKPVVGFNTMVRWHNTRFIGVTFFHNFNEELRKSSIKLGFSFMRMQEAVDSKLVKAVHLQRKKSKKIRGEKYTLPEIILTSHIIKFS